MDTPKTRDDLVNAAASILGVRSTGMPLSIEDYDSIDAYVDGLFSSLAAQNICFVPDEDDIPVELFDTLARLLANVCGPRYGSPISRDAESADKTELHRITAAKATYEVAEVEWI